ncbi:hypothetical protein H696_03245 [Fonticula alba]|uniref:Uncharacterized protein n=1 Tax=Fonticula alba TaxID=691883 RepID=A0A058Z6A3_FONAL|nr:hypothetical protein H696_03245 [Fonticula alba]KCV69800.1 hypothetical protein H696_03245 [Fonticula alba]|eukprot:XP_009495406.1 hypothetical protein H696_03245 [Fonticula alba]
MAAGRGSRPARTEAPSADPALRSGPRPLAPGKGPPGEALRHSGRSARCPGRSIGPDGHPVPVPARRVHTG